MRAEIMAAKLNSYNEGLAMSERASCQQNSSLDDSFVRKHVIDDTLEKHKKKNLLQEKALSTGARVSATNISRENWEMSYKKWQWLVILARLHIRFHKKNGFSFLKVVDKCGYCIEFKSNCFNCNLYKQNLCCSMKNLTKEKRESTALWKYLNTMQKSVKDYNKKINWKKDVLTYAIEMRNAIKKDKPKRQTKINSTFTPLQIFFPKAA